MADQNPPEQGVPYRGIESSMISGLAFLGPFGEDLFLDRVPEKGELRVMFKNGHVWSYAEYPRAQAEAFLISESAGKFYNLHLKGNLALTAKRIHPPYEEKEPQA